MICSAFQNQRVVIDDSSWFLDSDTLYYVDSDQLSCGTFFVNDVAVSPSYSDDRTLFLANNSYGLCKSTDGGDTWTKLTADFSVYAVTVSPFYADDSTVIAATEDGLLVSHEGGLSWLTMTEAPTGWGADVAFSPNFAVDGTVYASSAWGGFKSTDRGISWSAINNGLTNLYVEALAVSPDYGNDGTLFAGTHTGIFKSTDGGSSWKLTGTEIDMGSVSNMATNPRTGYSQPSVAIDSAGYAHIAGGGGNLHYQNNVGGAFSDPIIIPVPGTEGYYSIDVSIALDNSDKVHIAFRRTPNDSPGSLHPDGRIYYTSNSSGEFSIPVLAAPSSWQVANPYIATDANGYAHIAFEALGAIVGGSLVSGRNIYYANNTSEVFAQPVLVPPTDVPNNIPRRLRGIAVDSAGRVHIISWQSGENQDGRIDYATGVDGVFEPSIIAATGAYMDFISFAVDGDTRGDRNAHIVYRGPGNSLYHTNNVGGHFAEPAQIPGSIRGHRPAIAVDESGRAHIVYMNPFITGILNEVMYWTNAREISDSVRITDIGYGTAVGGQRWMAVRNNIMHIVFNNGRVGGGPIVGMIGVGSPGAPSHYVLSGWTRAGPEVYHMSAPIANLMDTRP